ncbi:hypothetical protein H4R18_001739 [Coemansia javaensis]|uniref:Guanylyl cyclase n=1 Tax=Coemansia javaensis TaxID=2761396 RepID=A0A9W8LKX7_9FUNG|nr:hypothetical protein H4R18_001739 [Coemansia javaensis]
MSPAMERLVACRLDDLARLSRLHPVSKVLQQAEWDCGLACVCMVVRAFGQPTCTVAQLARQAGTESVWTIDLALLLHRNLGAADFTYYTTCVGVNPSHAGAGFYSGALEGDEARILRLFAVAQQRLAIVELEIPLLDLQRFLVHRHYVALLLVDAGALQCMACRAGKNPSSPSSSSSFSPSSPRGVLTWLDRWRQRRGRRRGYLGHYILLIAFVPALDVFVYRDPAITDEFCIASAATIDAARRRPGTDSDCIIIKLQRTP